MTFTNCGNGREAVVNGVVLGRGMLILSEYGRSPPRTPIIDRRIQEFRNEASLLAGWAGHTYVVRVNASAGVGDVSKQILTGLEEFWSKQTAGRQP